MESIKVSKMSGKLKGFRAINFNPLDNSFCKNLSIVKDSVCANCYSMAMLKTFRRACTKPFSHNFYRTMTHLEDQELPRFYVEEHVRFLAHGEMLNEYHARFFVRTCEVNPHSYFSIWTKRPSLFESVFERSSKPSNLRIIQSSLFLNSKTEKHVLSDNTFTVFNDEDAIDKDEYFLCVGKKCADCMYCYSGKMDKPIAEVLRVKNKKK